MIINYGPLLLQLNPLSDILIKYGSNTTFETLSSSGVTDVYSIYKDSDGWALSIYQDCQLQISKSILSCDIGGCGGGGGGGTFGAASNHPTSAGGGGGSGGQVLSSIGLDLAPGVYDVTCGIGGASQTDGTSTILSLNGTNIFIVEGGTKGGNAVRHASWSQTYGDQVSYSGGTGGTKTYCSSGGNGSTGSKKASDGADGQYIFNTTIFTSLVSDWPDYIQIAAGGRGGAGVYVDPSTGVESPGTNGQDGAHDFEYGQGGGGGAVTPRAAQPGHNGILIIRQSYN